MAVSGGRAGVGARIRAREAARQEGVRAAILESAHAGARFIQSKLPKDLGELRRSVVVIGGGGRDELGRFTSKSDVRIEIQAPHAAFIERGTRPHMPPLGPLLAWVLRHAGDLGLADPDKEAMGVAMAIRWKIYNHGSKPRWILRGSLPVLREIVRRVIAARVRADGR